MPSIYEPAEDSYLMSDTLKSEIPKLLRKNPDLKFLEVGCGSGINLLTAKETGIKGNNINGLDVNPEAVVHCRKLGFSVINSNLFHKINGKFDVIIFNPPYLPLDIRETKSSRKETTGGKKGNEIAIEFLTKAKKHLNNNGKIFLITSSLSEGIDFESLLYNFKEVNSVKMFFERLYLWELTLKITSS